MSAVAYPEEPSYEALKAGYINLQEQNARLVQINQGLADQVINMSDRVADSKRELMDHGYEHAVEVHGIADPQPSPWASVQHVDVEAIEAEVASESELFKRLADEMKEGGGA